MVSDLSGEQFGRLTVLRREGRQRSYATWLCRCSCGTEVVVVSRFLVRGSTRSCGCLASEMSRERAKKQTHRRTHGRSKGDRTYTSWLHMRSRCLKPENPAFPDYGGRGITVCDRWKDSFENFLADMGECPEGMSLDRYPDNDGHYEPGNCRWATAKEQARNRRNSRTLEFNGQRRTVAEWSEQTGISQQTIGQRIDRRGWSVERALTTPTSLVKGF
jgi:hypothetical protein